MVSHPETGSDSPIGSDRDRGRDSFGEVRTQLRVVFSDAFGLIEGFWLDF